MKIDSLEKYENGFIASDMDIKLWDPVANQDVKLMGKEFGHLVVTGAVHLNGDVLYVCKCKCGRSSNATQTELESGKKVDCGCVFAKDMEDGNTRDLLRRKKRAANQRATRKKRKDGDAEKLLKYIGARYGKLTVRALAKRTKKDKELQFKCKCDCGNDTVKRYSNVISGKTKSCGCTRQKSKIGIEPWKQYGNMIAIKEAPKGANRHAAWICECEICGLRKTIRATDLKKLVSSKTCNCVEYEKRAQSQQARRKAEKAEILMPASKEIASLKANDDNESEKEEKINVNPSKERRRAELEIKKKKWLAEKEKQLSEEKNLWRKLQFGKKGCFDENQGVEEGAECGPVEWFEGL